MRFSVISGASGNSAESTWPWWNLFEKVVKGLVVTIFAKQFHHWLLIGSEDTLLISMLLEMSCWKNTGMIFSFTKLQQCVYIMWRKYLNLRIFHEIGQAFFTVKTQDWKIMCLYNGWLLWLWLLLWPCCWGSKIELLLFNNIFYSSAGLKLMILQAIAALSRSSIVTNWSNIIFWIAHFN